MLRKLILAATALTGLPLLLAWYVSQRVMHPNPRAEDNDLSNMPLPVEEVQFESRDGTALSGWFIPALAASRAAPGIVLSHGWARSRCELLPHAQFLHRAGYAVLLFDYRHRGLSAGPAITMGVRERDDLTAAIDTLAQRPEVDAARIGLLGMSMGGVISILVAADDPRIKAIAVECPYAAHDTIMSRSLRHYFKLPSFPFGNLARWALERRLGASLRDVEPINRVSELALRPIFIIADENDAVVGWEDSERLFQAAAEPKQLWTIPGSDHSRGWQFAPAEYEARVLDFFASSLDSAANVVSAPVHSHQ